MYNNKKMSFVEMENKANYSDSSDDENNSDVESSVADNDEDDDDDDEDTDTIKIKINKITDDTEDTQNIDDDLEDGDLEDDDDDDQDGGGGEDGDNDDVIGDLPSVNQSDDEDDEPDELYLQKFNSELNKNYIADFHPESLIHNYDEIVALSCVIRDQFNNVIDDLHKSIPYLTKYERARILGQRSKQINSGAKPFIKVPETIIDGYLIAELELIQKRIPFIIRRPIPGGSCEYWNLKDLEIICF